MEETASNPLKTRLPLVLLLLACTTVGLLVRIPWTGRVANATFDLMHGPVFCLVGWTLMWLVPPSLQPKFTALRIVLAILLVGFGGAAEYAQQFVGRDTSLHDLVANCLGVLAGWLIFEWMLRRKHRFGFVPFVAGFVVLLAAVRPAITELWDCAKAKSEFPSLDSFENGSSRWRGADATIGSITDPKLATDGDHVLQWDLQVAEYPGCHMYEPPRDWSAFDRLEFDIQLADNAAVEQLTITLKIQDIPHRTQYGSEFEDRFHREIQLTRGTTHAIAVDLVDIENSPATRKMEMSQIGLLELFSIDVSTAMTVYVDNVRLTKR